MLHDVVISSPRDREPPCPGGTLSRNRGKNLARENGELGKAVHLSQRVAVLVRKGSYKK